MICACGLASMIYDAEDATLDDFHLSKAPDANANDASAIPLGATMITFLRSTADADSFRPGILSSAADHHLAHRITMPKFDYYYSPHARRKDMAF